MLSVGRILELLDGMKMSQCVNAVWLEMSASRAQVADDIRRTRGIRAIVPVVVNRGFVNPNELLADVVAEIERHKTDVLVVVRGKEKVRLVMLLLSKVPLCVPQMSSPVTLPDWLPGIGGCVEHVTIVSLGRTAEVPLNAPEANVLSLQQRLLQLDRRMVGRLIKLREQDHGTFDGLFALIKRGDERPKELLEKFEVANRTANEDGFRPSVRDGRFVTSRLLGVVTATSPDGLNGTGKALATALARIPHR
jgi:CBS domain-containing protein